MSPGIGAAVVGCLLLMVTMVPARAQTNCDRSPPLVKFVSPTASSSQFVYARADRSGPAEYYDFTFSIAVAITPDTALLDAERFRDIRFRIAEIHHSPHSWDRQAADLGVPVFDGTNLIATVTYSGLPMDPLAFGRKTIQVLLPAARKPDGFDCIGSQEIEVFYDGHDASPYEKGVPNWFYYYKQNAIGQKLVRGDFQYGCEKGRSSASHGLGERCIRLCDDAYDARNTYYLADERARPLEVTGESEEIRYYTSFVATLMHELDHANNNVVPGDRAPDGADIDDDKDGLLDKWERDITHTAPGPKTVIDRGKYPRGSIINTSPSGPEPDNEMYAASIVERCAAQHADTRNDWAQPGTNYGKGFVLQDALRGSDGRTSALQCVPVSPPRPPDPRPCSP